MGENLDAKIFELKISESQKMLVKKSPCEVFVFLVGISLFIFFAGFAIYIYKSFSRPEYEKSIMYVLTF